MSFPFFSLFFTKQKSERVSDVAKRKMRNKTRKKCTFVERLITNSKFIVGIPKRDINFTRAETNTFFLERRRKKNVSTTPHPKLGLLSGYSLKKRCEYSVSGWHRRHEKEEEEVQSSSQNISSRDDLNVTPLFSLGAAFGSFLRRRRGLTAETPPRRRPPPRAHTSSSSSERFKKWTGRTIARRRRGGRRRRRRIEKPLL